MDYALRPGLSFCVANGRVTFLDTVADRYFCLPSDLDSRFQSFVATGSGGTDRELISVLAQRGLAVPAPDGKILDGRPAFPKPTREMPNLTREAIDWPALVAAALARHRASLDVRRRPMHHLIDTHQNLVASTTSRGVPALEGRFRSDMSAFQLSARLVSSFNECLSCSLALGRFLARRHLYPRIVLGVRMAPFSAHAWVQTDDLVLNDTVDMVTRYTPILVI
ncbi:lasso peptide biosynthesis B2 protein [Asticcacaulis sp.]|uniref:lasso peptide biosynthesis B2 protein n=1 Tax=Asticcacaulis sp. TaxID=1872648 RepID=UPI003F7BE9A4